MHAALQEGSYGTDAYVNRWFRECVLFPFTGLPNNYWVTPLSACEQHRLSAGYLTTAASDYDFEQDHEWAENFSLLREDLFLQFFMSPNLLLVRLSAGLAAAQTSISFGAWGFYVRQMFRYLRFLFVLDLYLHLNLQA
jgi:hypothetical protein